MQRLLDTYVITAGDVALNYAGRGFNPLQGRWITVSGANLGDSKLTPHVLRDADMVIQFANGQFQDGVLATTFVLNEPSNPAYATPWFQGMQSKGSFIMWSGHRPMRAGFFWRILASGLAAGDIVTLGAGYE